MKRVQCNYCQKEIVQFAGRMRRHLEKCPSYRGTPLSEPPPRPVAQHQHRRPKNNIDPLIQRHGSGTQSSPDVKPFSVQSTPRRVVETPDARKQQLDVAAAVAVYKSGMPLTMFDKEMNAEMYDFVTMLNPCYEPPDARGLSELVEEIKAQELREQLKSAAGPSAARS